MWLSYWRGSWSSHSSCRDCAKVILGCNQTDNNVEASLLQHIVSEKEIINMLSNPSKTKIREAVFCHLLQDLHHAITPLEMLDVMDSAGISQKGYRALYRLITSGLRVKGFKRSVLPTPYSLEMARKTANGKVDAMFNGYRWVEDLMPLVDRVYEYNKFNNVYIDMEELQRAMVRYYDLTIEETRQKLIFVLKLDECQVVKGQRLERVSVTLMSRALDGRPLELDEIHTEQATEGDAANYQQCYYGVQSEKNIWWQAAWTLPHESHDTLRWYFSKAGIDQIISRQVHGQKLQVIGIGDFDVEWHLGGDLKTLKCMLGCKGGANTLFPCIYCCHSKSNVSMIAGKGRTPSKEKGRCQKGTKNTMSSDINRGKSSKEWQNGILSCDRSRPPSRDQEDRSWNPILPIPLSQVHVCTLHARLRILDKLMMLHINYAWNMEPALRRQESIRALESILSAIGLHSGAVVLTKDTKSNPTQDNPNKICMGGSKARHLLANHSKSGSHTEFEVWKKICDVTTYRGNEHRLGLKRARVWEACDKMVSLLERPLLDNNGIEVLKQNICKFTEEMVEAWGETHITHYMVRKHSFILLKQHSQF